jgi:hypothetical protein
VAVRFTTRCPPHALVHDFNLVQPRPDGVREGFQFHSPFQRPVHDKSRVAALKGDPLFADSEVVTAMRRVAINLEIPLYDTHAELILETNNSALGPNFFIDVVHLSP